MAGLTKSAAMTATKLTRIAQMSQERPDSQTRWLMPHFNVESLKACFNELDGRKAVGVDGMSKDEYQVELEERLGDLVARMKSMTYRPGPVREVLIPKEGRPGEVRPLGISNFEDKVVQLMTAKILQAIYEPTFRNCSYGFRPNRSCHTAIKTLSTLLHQHQYSTVIDIDLKNYFGSIDHGKLVEMLRYRIKDETFIRYIVRMLKAGVLSDGELRMSEEGSPQGNGASPILSNIYGHYVIDCWFEDTVKSHCRGRVELVRYCDDMVIVCQLRHDAERITTALEKRLAKFSLSLNHDKTRLVWFSRKGLDRGKRQGTFDFLGFTFYLGKTQKGNLTTKLKTSRKRLRSKLGKVNDWLRENRCRMRLMELWKVFVRKLQGHVCYYGVSFNTPSVNEFLWRARRLFFKWINRRSQKRSLNWPQFEQFTQRHPLPTARVYVSLF